MIEIKALFPEYKRKKNDQYYSFQLDKARNCLVFWRT